MWCLCISVVFPYPPSRILQAHMPLHFLFLPVLIHQVGCAEAKRDYKIANGNTHTCRTIVCRYAKPGNCSMGKYKDPKTNIVDWETPMMLDDSPCGPFCPPEDVCFE